MTELLVSLKWFTSCRVQFTSLLHEVNDLWHRILLYRVVFHICRRIERSENCGPEYNISHHKGEPGKGRSIGDLAQRGVFDEHLNELLSDFELHLGKRTNEITCSVYQDVLCSEVPLLHVLEELWALWLPGARRPQTDLVAVQLYGEEVVHRHEGKSTCCRTEEARYNT